MAIKNFNQQIADQIKLLFEQGAFIDDMMKVLHLTRHTTVNYCQYLNLPMARRRRTGQRSITIDPSLAAKIKEMFYAGTSLQTIDRECGFGEGTRQFYFDYLGIDPKSRGNVNRKTFEQPLIDEVERLYYAGGGSRSIAKKLSISREDVSKIYELLDLDTSNRTNPKKIHPTEKPCKTCGAVKPIDQFGKRSHKATKRNGDVYYYEFVYGNCIECEKEEISKRNKEYYIDTWDQQKEYRERPDIKERISSNNKLYRENNKEDLQEKANAARRKKRKEDPCFRLRERLSSEINMALKASGSSKNGSSILKHLPYTMEELKAHLTSLFSHPNNLTPNGEAWMHWDNWHRYNARTWNDNDSSTWVWNIDHIIPHSEFHYTSMDDADFLACWALSNLRPYSAKLNIIEGTNQTRHTYKKRSGPKKKST